MNAFPAFFPLAGRTVVIAGSGEAAEVKARLFEGSPARVVRAHAAAALDPATYAGAALAFVAGGDDAFRAGARAAARAAGVPVNVVDHPELCDFTTPALIDRGEVVAAVGTDGASPMLAALLRSDIEARVPEGAGRLAALLRTMQDEVRAALPDLPARRAFLRAALTGPAAQAAMAGETDLALSLLRAALAAQAGAAPSGRVCAIAGPAAADLISLRAARRLAEADVLVLGAGADPAIVALARRDARRLSPAEADLAALAGQGMLVVVVPPPTAAALSALSAAGVDVEILAAAPGGA
jgi:precorrin-2 dehydrogenase/sirohydrochlorin ferrochelatase